MTASGTRQANGPRSWRVLTVVLALYALVLQAVLGGASALPTSSPLDVLCLQQMDASGAAAPGAPHDPAHHHAGCCTLCHPAAAASPPLAVASAIVWPARLVSRRVGRSDGTVAARAPPPAQARPRAPPVV